jgi:4-amino-4-deoxy-L-arabinose transferase-like glycosyltransferase
MVSAQMLKSLGVNSIAQYLSCLLLHILSKANYSMLENNPRLKNILIASLIVIAALGMRIAYIVGTDVDLPIRADARSYVNYAQNLVNHGTFSKETSKNPTPDSFWSPGYPAFLATNIYLFGIKHLYPTTQFLQALLGALASVMVFVIGLFFLPRWAATLAGLLTACSPHLISLGSYLLTETLFAFTLLSFLLLYIIAIRTEKSCYFASSGAVAGVSYLVNPVIFFAPFIMAGLFFIKKIHHRPSLIAKKKQLIVIFLLAFMTPWTLWTVRCCLNVPVTSDSATNRALVNLIVGAHHDFYEIWRADPRDPTNPVEVDKRRVNSSWSKFLNILGRRIVDNPWHYTKWYFYEKPKLLWSWDILTGQGDVYVYPVITSWFQTSLFASGLHFVMKSIHWWLLFLGFLGGLFLHRFWHSEQGEVIITLYAVTVYVSAVYVILQSEARYSIPLRPAMYLCASFGLWQVGCAARNWLNNFREKMPQRVIQ